MKEKRSYVVFRVLSYLGFACLVLSGLVLGSCGCSSVDPKAIEDAIVKELPNSEPAKPAIVDELSTYQIASCHQGAGDEWLRWPATHPLKATLKGGKLHLESTAFKAWPDKDNVVGACWFIVQRGGKWKAYCWDYIRASGAAREIPFRDPANPVSWETIIPGERWFACVTGLYRDKRRNVSERTVIAEVEQ